VPDVCGWAGVVQIAVRQAAAKAKLVVLLRIITSVSYGCIHHSVCLFALVLAQIGLCAKVRLHNMRKSVAGDCIVLRD